MTKIQFFALACLILLTSQSQYAYGYPPVPPATEAEEIEVRAAARKRIEEYELLKPELFDYGPSQTEWNNSIMVFGGKTQFFSTTLQVDQKKGDLMLVVECIGDEKVEFNLTYNFRDIYRWFSADQTEPKETEGSSSSRSIDAPQPVRKYEHNYEDSEDYESPARRGIIYMHKDEFFMKKIKIWDMMIWDQLVSVSKEEPNSSFKLRYHLLFKVNDTFYRAKSDCSITARQIRSLEIIRNKPQKTDERSIPQENHYDRQLRITVDKGEKGESIINLEPVSVKSE